MDGLYLPMAVLNTTTARREKNANADAGKMESVKMDVKTMGTVNSHILRGEGKISMVN